MRIRHLAVLTLTAILVAACGSGNHKAQQPAPTSTATATATTLPGSLPTFSPDGNNAEQAMQQLIQLAVQHAVGITDKDRHPTVAVTLNSVCGAMVAAATCNVHSANEPVTITINPTVARQNYQHAVGHGGGDAPWQNTVLGSVINYLMFRETQRTNAALLNSASESDFPAIIKLQNCKTGNVVGPLLKAMSPELAGMFAHYQDGDSKPDYNAGARGKC